MNVFIFSTLLAAVFLTACSCHRQTSARRTSFVTRSQIGRICDEIGTLKEEIWTLKGEIVTLKNENSNQQKEISMLHSKIDIQENTISELQEEVDELKIQSNQTDIKALVEKVDGLEVRANKAEYKSAFAIYGHNPTEAAIGVMTFPEEGVITNIGDDFDPVTGLYTAPVNGTYVFVFNMYKDFTITSFITCDILRNGQAVGNAFVPPTTDGYLEASAATVLYLKKDETVSLGRCQNIDGVYDLTSFMGFLLRAD